MLAKAPSDCTRQNVVPSSLPNLPMMQESPANPPICFGCPINRPLASAIATGLSVPPQKLPSTSEEQASLKDRQIWEYSLDGYSEARHLPQNQSTPMTPAKMEKPQQEFLGVTPNEMLSRYVEKSDQPGPLLTTSNENVLIFYNGSMAFSNCLYSSEGLAILPIAENTGHTLASKHKSQLNKVRPNLQEVQAQHGAKSRHLNAFMLFRKIESQKLKREFPGISNNDISKILGSRWKNADQDIKDHYKALSTKFATRASEHHTGLHTERDILDCSHPRQDNKNRRHRKLNLRANKSSMTYFERLIGPEYPALPLIHQRWKKDPSGRNLEVLLNGIDVILTDFNVEPIAGSDNLPSTRHNEHIVAGDPEMQNIASMGQKWA